ncbi:MAG: pyridoxal phosphate-dependent aminotransferase [Acidobacteriota bacterium]
MSLRPARRVAGLRRTLIREIFESAPPDALNLGLGQPDLRPPPVLEQALARAATDGPAGYGPTQGDAGLRDRIAADYGGFARSAADVIVTAGCQEATFVTLGCLLDAGDEVLVPDPGFPGAARAAEAFGAAVRRYPLRAERGFHLDVDEVLGLVGPETRAVVVISPSNPTGTVEPQATLDALVEATARAGVALVLDDTYRDMHWLAPGRAPGAPAEPRGHVVVCGGLSKSASLTGWRLGWAICPDPEFMRRMVAFQQTVLTCAATPIQIAARVAFEPEGRAGIAGICRRFRARRDLAARVLAGRGVRHAPLEGAFYAFVDAAAAGGGRQAARDLLERDSIVVIPGEAFGEAAADWIRVSYAQDDALLAPALETIADRLAGA